jgi:hypothetical protein
MNVQLDWQAGDENGVWETIAATENRIWGATRGRIWRVLAFAAAVIFAAGSISTALLMRHYDAALGRITAQIQDAIDQEAQDSAVQPASEPPEADRLAMPATVQEVEMRGDTAFRRPVAQPSPRHPHPALAVAIRHPPRRYVGRGAPGGAGTLGSPRGRDTGDPGAMPAGFVA